MTTDNNTILLVEDSDEDYYTTKRAFEKGRLANHLRRVTDGQQALDYLFHKGEYQDADKYPLPAIILLDLNLPGLDGRDVLRKLKADEKSKRIPVIVLTTSSDQNDIDQCYHVGANSYIQKPVDVNNFVTALQRLVDYWFEVVILPR
jgi:CheY-like chemotaxis protein